MVVLEGTGMKYDSEFKSWPMHRRRRRVAVELEEAEGLSLEGIMREFRMYVMEVNPETQELRLRLEVITPEQSSSSFVINDVDSGSVSTIFR